MDEAATVQECLGKQHGGHHHRIWHQSGTPGLRTPCSFHTFLLCFLMFFWSSARSGKSTTLLPTIPLLSADPTDIAKPKADHGQIIIAKRSMNGRREDDIQCLSTTSTPHCGHHRRLRSSATYRLQHCFVSGIPNSLHQTDLVSATWTNAIAMGSADEPGQSHQSGSHAPIRIYGLLNRDRLIPK
ncbi:hypothetical protein B0H65DRAFT_472314 [Neurospora tetraspora]|uniref:Uncharacterized protein n=1 Tax=Neurospora tetraspora TaxID=94610 RepID=A0AAE0MPA6_9PEZI|nr:hypothetical protein B0H65DRAFT_472314 [Neurospora tetraspora]